LKAWDAIVVGSGFGGSMTAHVLVNAGYRVLMIERGSWVGRHGDDPDAGRPGLQTRHYVTESAYDVRAGRKHYTAGSWSCVGGPSIFYGGASYRFRRDDFGPHPDLVGSSGAEWPFGYDELEPYYCTAERMLHVAGEARHGSEPPRSQPYPQRPAPLAPSSASIFEAARRLGMQPSRIPLAITYADPERACRRCGKCDGFACPTSSKNDLATNVIPDLVRQGMELRANTVCVSLERSGSRITAVHCVDRATGRRERLSAETIIVAAGALATPHLLLASGVAAVNPAADAIGRYLMRHRNAVVFGAFRHRPNPRDEFDKHVAILDFYREAGCIQQLTPAEALVRAYLPRPLRIPAALFLRYASGLLVIAEDQPRPENRVTVDESRRDRFGLPQLRVRHAYTPRDETAARLLVRHARRVLREAGARFTLVRGIETWSHALGTVRMGLDPHTSPLDGAGRFRGVDNLYVVDGSALPRSAGVNPSLTIAANALRVASLIAESSPVTREQSFRSLPVWHPQPVLEIS
jgi:choline dehydrogenase-like flavoprotein